MNYMNDYPKSVEQLRKEIVIMRDLLWRKEMALAILMGMLAPDDKIVVRTLFQTRFSDLSKYRDYL